MKWFKNLKIASKLLISFLIVASLTAVVGIFGLSNMSSINNMLDSLYQNELRGVSFVKEANVNLIYYSRATRNLLLSESESIRNEYIDQMKLYEEQLFNNIDNAKKTVASERGKELLAEFEKEWKTYKNINDRITTLVLQDDSVTALEIARTEARAKGDDVDTILSKLARLKDDEGKNYMIESSEVYAEARNFMIVLMVIAIASGIVIGFVISRVISKPIIQVVNSVNALDKIDITSLAKGIDALSHGDLSHQISVETKPLEYNYSDEIGTLSESINSIIKSSGKTVESYENTRKKLNNLLDEANNLTIAAQNGKLEERGRTDKYEGVYKDLVAGINSTLDETVAPMKESAAVLKIMSTGDLSVRVKGDYKGDFKLMKESINQLGDSLGDLLQKIQEASEATASASSQISSSSEEMAAGAQEQSSQADEVASAVEEMTKTILENSKNAGSAAEHSNEAMKIAENGGDVILKTVDGITKIAEVVQKASATVKELGNSSNEIGKIVQVINDIADQTNLLALNAAIEAARAGEHGRGFAVVADEVRKLAERTTKATKEIETMILQIQEDTDDAVSAINQGTSEVEEGKKLADQSGKSLKDILEANKIVSDMINQVSAATEQQSSSAEQIGKNIEGISTVTNQSAASTQQIARAADDLNKLTLNLQNLVSKFKVEQVSQAHTSSNGNGNGKRSNGEEFTENMNSENVPINEFQSN